MSKFVYCARESIFLFVKGIGQTNWWSFWHLRNSRSYYRETEFTIGTTSQHNRKCVNKGRKGFGWENIQRPFPESRADIQTSVFIKCWVSGSRPVTGHTRKNRLSGPISIRVQPLTQDWDRVGCSGIWLLSWSRWRYCLASAHKEATSCSASSSSWIMVVLHEDQAWTLFARAPTMLLASLGQSQLWVLDQSPVKPSCVKKPG